MTQLVALLSTGKGSWAHVAKLMRQSEFDETILLTNTFGKEKFQPETNTTIIEIDFNQPVHTLQDIFIRELRPRIKGVEVALNMMSGTGVEHMALLSALLKLGLAIRLVVAGEEVFEEL